MPKAALDSQFSFPRKNRLKGRAAFRSVLYKPNKIKHLNLIAVFKPNELGFARIGIMISKHDVPRAIDRNHVRRIVRESVRKMLTSLQAFDIIVIFKKPYTIKDLKTIDIDPLWRTFKS